MAIKVTIDLDGAVAGEDLWEKVIAVVGADLFDDEDSDEIAVVLINGGDDGSQ